MTQRRAWRRFTRWSGRVQLGNKLIFALVLIAIICGVATYAVMTATTPLESRERQLFILLNIDLVVLLALGALIARRMVRVWASRGQAGGQLHVQMAALFSLVAVAPAIIVAIFSAIIFNVGLQGWFSDRVSTAVNASLSVAQAYLREHEETLRADALSMANDLNREAPRLINDAEVFNRFVTTQAILRGLTEALVMDGTGRALARSNLTFALQFESIPDGSVQQARTGSIVPLETDTDDRVRLVMRLDSFVDTFLIVGRLVEPSVLANVESTEGAVAEYQALESQRSSLQITFTLFYLLVALLLLLSAVWIGLSFADSIVRPIGRLIGAADRISDGDLSARVPNPSANDEIGALSTAFNKMTRQLETQRHELIEANRQLDRRRRFIETVLSGVSAGVLGLDGDGRVNLPNKSATELLGRTLQDLVGHKLIDVFPEIEPLFETVERNPGRLVEGQVKIDLGGETRTLLVRIVSERVESSVRGYVVTFDEITELLSAQRVAAWADVARRIAHEIKNPLTPIQLSAERLKRRYLKEISSDKEVFVTCTDTIIRQVGDIGQMVDEFSAFARMPSPVMKPIDMVSMCQNAVFLQRNARTDIQFALDMPDAELPVRADERQVGQVLTNILQNAIDAVDGRDLAADGTPPPGGRIVMSALHGDDAVIVRVSDNGKGLPTEDRHRLTEPYVTTRERGTGLGLAIVKKIMEDHGGRLAFFDGAEGGAVVELHFPFGSEAVDPEADNPEFSNDSVR
ncbi:MAG: PAS domain-containing sensor histidine kinase [Pseudomonadota bacterium]